MASHGSSSQVFVVIDFVYLLSCDELEVFLGLFIFAKLQIDCDNRNGIEDIVPFLFHNRQQFLHLFKLGFLQFLFQPLLALNSVEVRQDTGKKASKQTLRLIRAAVSEPAAVPVLK